MRIVDIFDGTCMNFVSYAFIIAKLAAKQIFTSRLVSIGLDWIRLQVLTSDTSQLLQKRQLSRLEFEVAHPMRNFGHMIPMTFSYL